jgi:glycosyltransferase involved in cell wall biosynthesis
MQDLSSVRERFNALRCCVIIPTYNNDRFLEKVVEGVGAYTSHIIVVNDGSTDATADILARHPECTVLTIPVNRGKGNALRTGFRHATELGYWYAITIDSDGQHFPEDLPRFLDAIEADPDAMVVGARNMNQAEVPGTSSFGHNFSIFWFRVETGQKIPDVQTGYRLYPLDKVKEIKHFFTRKYEFEVEILVRLAWRDVKVISVPVKVYYAPKGERVSHFRKFRDFTRVSIVNTVLVFMALLWVRPFRFAKGLRKKSLREFINDYIINSGDSNARIAASVTLGLFMGVMPIWGWQMVASFGLAHVLKLNKFVTVASSNISIPPFLPLILLASYATGGWILGLSPETASPDIGFGMQWIKDNLIQYLVGSLVFGVALAGVLGSLSYLLLSVFRKPAAGIPESNPANEKRG